MDMGDLASAEEQWRRVITDVPNYEPGWRGLAETLLRMGRNAEADKIA
jgi:hypothetical protein